MELSALQVTARRKTLLERKKIFTAEDLLRDYPLRYELIEAVPFALWEKGDAVAFEGTVSMPPRTMRLEGRRTLTRFKVIAWNEELEVSVFNRPWASQLKFGSRITFFGQYAGSARVTVTSYNTTPLEKQKGLRPVYSLVKDMRQSDMQAVMHKALAHKDLCADMIPERYRNKYRLLHRQQALQWIHFPPGQKELHQAVRTLKYEEFLLFQVTMQAMQKEREAKEPKVFDRALVQEKIAALPYALTADQASALEDILADMEDDHVMYRMVQGDVGCGKTAVGMLALYACELSGQQAAFLAPTEILARQHQKSLEKLGLESELLVGSLSARQKKKVLADLKAGKIRVLVGTHALFQDPVEFEKLGLVVVDEQQRFGVKQRRSLLEKGSRSDFLMMTATPIPRTYAHFLYGDIAMSSIHTMPPGRMPPETHYVSTKSMGPVLQPVLAGLRDGRQCYVVCPMIEDSADLDLRAAESIYEGMVKTLKNRVRIGLLHGKMKPAEKDAIMERFKEGELDVLVSTTVIEVGIDVPNATLMVIYDAHRFGLSTLHQLRGRVARGKERGICWLLSGSKDAEAIERLQALEHMADGFSVSSYDLKKRGPGDILGTRQSGLPSFVLGDFEKDPAIMEVCIKDAAEILQAGTDSVLLACVAEAVEKARYFD